MSSSNSPVRHETSSSKTESWSFCFESAVGSDYIRYSCSISSVLARGYEGWSFCVFFSETYLLFFFSLLSCRLWIVNTVYLLFISVASVHQLLSLYLLSLPEPKKSPAVLQQPHEEQEVQMRFENSGSRIPSGASFGAGLIESTVLSGKLQTLTSFLTPRALPRL